MEFSLQLQETILSSLLAITCICVAAAIFHFYGRSKKQSNKSLPEPAGALPIAGHLRLLQKNKLLHRFLGDIADTYGPAFSVRLGIHRALVVSSWEIAKECFTTNDKVFCTRPKYLAVKIMGYNHTMLGFAPYGRYWRDIRKLAVVQLLSHRRLDLLKHVRDAEINSLIKDLYGKCIENGGSVAVEMKQLFGDMSINIIVRMVAGKRYSVDRGGENEESRRCQKALGDFFYLVGLSSTSDAIPFLGWLDLLNGNIGRMKRTAKELDWVLGRWVREHREKRDKGSICEKEKDFIDVMLSFVEEDGRFSTTQEADAMIKANCLSLILGGYDTTMITLTWAISLLLNNQDVLKKAQEELDTKVGKDRQVADADIRNLKYVQAIVKETLRLYPAAPLSAPREAMEDCTVAGFHVPAGTRLFINLWKLQRDPTIWKRPNEFLPERFLYDHPDLDVTGQDFMLMPFGSGRRMCPGVSLALQVLHLTLARFLQGFELGTISDSAIDLSEGPGLTVPKATPLEVTLAPRLSSSLYV